MVLLAGLTFAHGARFGLAQLSVPPEDPDVVWAVSSGWGVVHTADGGATWTWLCEEALGVTAVYDVEALGTDAALLATSGGLLRVDTGCGATVLPGLPADGYPAFIERDGDAFLVSAYAEARSGLWTCTEAGCAEGAVGGVGVYVKSVAVDGATTWVTSVEAESLAATLWRVRDGEVERVAEWPEGRVDPRVLRARGDDLLLWEQGRDAETVPRLVRSRDGGRGFVPVLSMGAYTDPIPGLMCGDDTCYLGADAGRTWFSPNGGDTWAEVTEAAPAVRCSETAGDGYVFCADHYADGFDAGWWAPDRPVRGIGCLDEALPPACAPACDAAVPAFQEAGLYGGGECRPAPPDVPVEDGCGGSRALLVPAGLLLLGRRARRRA